MPFTSIAKTVSANQDDEVWMEIHSYKDRKHADEVQAKIKNDGNMKPICGGFFAVCIDKAWLSWLFIYRCIIQLISKKTIAL
jgi:Protein of unknown function (DUF1428)